MVEALPRLFIGAAEDRANPRFKAVCTIMTTAEISSLPSSCKLCPDILYLEVPVFDGRLGLGMYLDTISSFYNNAGRFGDVLIHCRYGQSRSPAVALYLNVLRYDYTYDEALKFIKDLVPDCWIYDGYLDEIKNKLLTV
jgi:hypothetical protein